MEKLFKKITNTSSGKKLAEFGKKISNSETGKKVKNSTIMKNLNEKLSKLNSKQKIGGILQETAFNRQIK